MRRLIGICDGHKCPVGFFTLFADPMVWFDGLQFEAQLAKKGPNLYPKSDCSGEPVHPYSLGRTFTFFHIILYRSLEKGLNWKRKTKAPRIGRGCESAITKRSYVDHTCNVIWRIVVQTVNRCSAIPLNVKVSFKGVCLLNSFCPHSYCAFEIILSVYIM